MKSGLIVVILGALALLYSSIFVVSEGQRALVLRFGQIVRSVDEPGLYFKQPFIEEALIIDKRLVYFESNDKSVQVVDSRRYLVDTVTVYRVVDPRKFREAVNADFDFAKQRIETRVDAALRETYGKRAFQAALSEERAAMMREIRDRVKRETRDLGVEVVDVRIRRTDLPQDVLEQTYNRMNAERRAEAEQIRAIGNQQNLTIRAQADRDYTVTLANAQREAEITRGQGDAEKNLIYAEAVSRDPEFFSFYRSMEAYEAGLTGDDTFFVLQPGSEFFRYFRQSSPPTVAPAPKP